jgi:hypothetical protein
MTDPNAPRSLKRVWLGVLVIVVILVIAYAVNRARSNPPELRTDSVPAATPQQ